MLHFLVRSPMGAEKEVRVDEDRLVAGRDAGADLVLDDPAAGDRHFLVEIRDGIPEIDDLKSPSGTIVRGGFAGSTRLDVGDEIKVGALQIYLMGFGGAGVPKPTRPSSRAASRPPAPPRRSSSTMVPALALLLMIAVAVGAVVVFAPKDNAEPIEIGGLPPDPEGPADVVDSPQIPAAVPVASALELELRKPWLERTDAVVLPPVRVEPPVEVPTPERVPETARIEPPVPGPTEEPGDTDVLARAQEELTRLEETLPDRIAEFRYDAPLADVNDIIYGLPSSELKDRAEGLAADLTAAKNTVERMKTSLASGGQTVELASGLALKVTAVDEEGFEGKTGAASVRKRWSELSPLTIHSAASQASRDAPALIELAAFASLHGLVEDAEADLARAFKKDEGSVYAISAALARIRGVPIPEGGFVLHDSGWVTPEEKGYLDQGLVLEGGRWMTRDEAMAARGFVKHEGKWLSPEDYADVLEAQLEAQELAKKYLPKGFIDILGHGDSVPWAKKIELKTAHYRINTNLSKEVAKDLAYTMEILRTNLARQFGLRGKGQRCTVNVVATRQEYGTQWSRAGGSLGFFAGDEICTFYQPPMTTSVLMHEGTHQMVHRFASGCPRWLHEGLATYFECSQFEFDAEKRQVSLAVGLLNSNRLTMFQAEMKSGRAVSLETFLNGRGGNPYHQGWALVYYLAKGADGKYAKRFHEFVQKAGNGENVEKFQKIFRIRDLAQFETEWLEFIKALDPKDGVSLAKRHE